MYVVKINIFMTKYNFLLVLAFMVQLWKYTAKATDNVYIVCTPKHNNYWSIHKSWTEVSHKSREWKKKKKSVISWFCLFFFFLLRTGPSVPSLVSLWAPNGRTNLWYGLFLTMFLRSESGSWRGRCWTTAQRNICSQSDEMRAAMTDHKEKQDVSRTTDNTVKSAAQNIHYMW